MVSIQEEPNNYPLYYVHSNIDSFILYNNECVEEEVSHLEIELSKTEEIKLDTEKQDEEGKSLWNMDFDGVVSKEGVGVGILISSTQTCITKGHAYKLNFQCTNNITEYEP